MRPATAPNLQREASSESGKGGETGAHADTSFAAFSTFLGHQHIPAHPTAGNWIWLLQAKAVKVVKSVLPAAAFGPFWVKGCTHPAFTTFPQSNMKAPISNCD
jgi:hypothetical protein